MRDVQKMCLCSQQSHTAIAVYSHDCFIAGFSAATKQELLDIKNDRLGACSAEPVGDGLFKRQATIMGPGCI